MKDFINWLTSLPEEISEEGYVKILEKWKSGMYMQVYYVEGKGIEFHPKLKQDRKCIY